MTHSGVGALGCLDRDQMLHQRRMSLYLTIAYLRGYIWSWVIAKCTAFLSSTPFSCIDTAILPFFSLLLLSLSLFLSWLAGWWNDGGWRFFYLSWLPHFCCCLLIALNHLRYSLCHSADLRLPAYSKLVLYPRGEEVMHSRSGSAVSQLSMFECDCK